MLLIGQYGGVAQIFRNRHRVLDKWGVNKSMSWQKYPPITTITPDKRGKEQSIWIVEQVTVCMLMKWGR